jgi:hypothetical protein
MSLQELWYKEKQAPEQDLGLMSLIMQQNAKKR